MKVDHELPRDNEFVENVMPARMLDCTLTDYWYAPSGTGPLAGTWEDKPHRLLYDLISYALWLEAEIEAIARNEQEN